MENTNKNLVETEVKTKTTTESIMLDDRTSQLVETSKIQTLSELQLSIEDKAAHLSLQVNQVIIKPYLNQALDYMLNSRDEVVAAYNNLSEEISQEVEVLLQTNKVLSNQVAKAKSVVAETQALIRVRYSEATEFEIASGVLNLDNEYNMVAENYEKSMQLSQEIVKNRMRIESLLETQRLLDSSLSTRVSEIQIEIDNLTLLLENLTTTKLTGKMIDLSSQFAHGQDLSQTVAKLSEGDAYVNDASLFAHVQSSRIASDLRRLASGEAPADVESTVQVDEKELFVVKKNKPINLARLGKNK